MRPSESNRQFSLVPRRRGGLGRHWAALWVGATGLFLALPAGGPALSAQGTALQRQVDAILSDPALRGARVSCRVVDCKTGAVLYSYHADEALVPASNMKLLTTAAALETLSGHFRFQTRLGIVGRDLVVIGSGDPNISGRFFDGQVTAVFERWAKALADRGISAIAGDLVGDDTLFDREYVHPTWPREQLSSWYCAPVGALSLNDNCADISVDAGRRPGERPTLRAEPQSDYVTLLNRSVTVGAGEPLVVNFTRRPGTAQVTVTGRVPLGVRAYSAPVTIDNAGLFFLAGLRRVLERQGITVTGSSRLADAPTRMGAFTPLATHTSTLEETVKVTNQRSQNFYAEALLKLVGARTSGGPGSFANGAAAVGRLLATLGVGDAALRVADGSGLSRDNRVSAKHLTDLLAVMSRRPAGTIYRDSLATAGVDGGMQRRMTEAPFRGRIHAKTGTLSGVSALSGYVDTLDGRLLAFSILINDHRAATARVRDVEDNLCKALVRAGQD